MIVTIILFIWQLPQNLLGLLLGSIVGFHRNDRWFYEWKSFSGISLGRYIFLNKHCSNKTLMHEKGHQKQSLYLGWFYLLIIGIPSFIWCILHTYVDKFKNINYYSFYTEKWADYLGKVKR